MIYFKVDYKYILSQIVEIFEQFTLKTTEVLQFFGETMTGE
jgi:hypothetical protein